MADRVISKILPIAIILNARYKNKVRNSINFIEFTSFTAYGESVWIINDRREYKAIIINKCTNYNLDSYLK
jgi:hypothetical protein